MATNDGSRRALTGGCDNLVDTRIPGEWPGTPVSDALRAQYNRERSRREITLTAIRAELEEQPSPRAIRACARRWCTEITNLAETVITSARRTEPNE